MGIQRIIDQKTIATIFGIHDERLEDQVSMSRAEWTQFLINSTRREEFIGIWGLVKDNKVQRYMVAVNAVNPPISRSVLILYQNFFEDNDNGIAALEEVKAWARAKGAEKLAIQTLYPRVNARFGFQKEKGESMYLEI